MNLTPIMNRQNQTWNKTDNNIQLKYTIEGDSKILVPRETRSTVYAEISRVSNFTILWSKLVSLFSWVQIVLTKGQNRPLLILRSSIKHRSQGWMFGHAMMLHFCPLFSDVQVMFSPTVDRTVPKIPGKGQISLHGGGARQHLWRHNVAIGVTLPYAAMSCHYALNN